VTDDKLTALYEAFAAMGIEAAKVKVGFPTVEEDIERLVLVREVFGRDCTLMADANEAWSPKEAIRRLQAYRDAGIDLHWIEDSTFRGNVSGVQQVVNVIPFTAVNTGEYCGFEGKRRLLENGASDILNVHGITPARKAAHLASACGIPLSTGTDHAADHCAVHLGAALPEVEYAEFVHQRFYDIADEPFAIEDGYAIAPDRPGHGIELPPDALDEYGERTGGH
jgi:L-alanine-DL-glutamate epimerase-like enolase superfamily enzyme